MYIRPCHKTEQWQHVCVLSMLNITKYSKRGHKLICFCFVFITPEGFTTMVANEDLERARTYMHLDQAPGTDSFTSLQKVRCKNFR